MEDLNSSELPSRMEEYLNEAQDILAEFSFSFSSKYTTDSIVKIILDRNDPDFKEAFLVKIVEAVDNRRRLEAEHSARAVMDKNSIINSEMAVRGFERLEKLRERLEKIII